MISLESEIFIFKRNKCIITYLYSVLKILLHNNQLSLSSIVITVTKKLIITSYCIIGYHA